MVSLLFKSTIFVTALLFLNGCGGNLNLNTSDDQPHHPYKNKIERTNWVKISKPGESDMGVLEKSLDGQNMEIRLIKGEKKGAHYQFFIDTDRNSQTGYNDGWISDGADYVIEDGRVYKSLSNSDEWRWQRVGSVTFLNDDRSVYTLIMTQLLGDVDPDFRVGAVCLDDSWHYVSKIIMNSLEEGKITIDADSSDWGDIERVGVFEFGELKFYNDDENIYFMVQNGSLGQHTQIFINADNNSQSGYLPAGGAEYLIEDDRFYISVATSDLWEWERAGYVEYAKDGNLMEIAVSRDKMVLNDKTLFISALALDENFRREISSVESVRVELTTHRNGSLIISEVMASNGHTVLDPDFFAFCDWIEIYNASDDDIDIGGYYLGDSLKDGSWEIPQKTVIKSKEYMIFWADGEDIVLEGMHTDFTLKSKGEEVAIFDRNGDLVDGFAFGRQKTDISCTHNNNRIFFTEPTPGEKNSKSFETLQISRKPLFSIGGGFYQNGVNVEISSPQENAKIYYTTDGSYPGEDSNIYTAPVTIDKTTVLRARARTDGKFLSDEIVATYFIGESTTLPVVSISTDEKYLFDDEIGIYTEGVNGTLSPGCTEDGFIANYFQDWARPAYIEFFDENKNPGFSQEVELEISGSCSRVIPQKSLKISAKEKYGSKKISYKLFADKPFTEYEGFKLRSSGQDWFQTMIRDGFLHRVIRDDFDVDYQEYRPCIVFINGEYYGIHNIREKKNRDFLARNHPGVKKKKIDILYDNAGVKKGSADDYNDMINFIKTHDLSSDENYQIITSRMDVENYIDYMIAQTFYLNQDWPYTNVRFWREDKEGAKWRWIFEDQDVSFGPWNDPMDINIFDLLTPVDNITYANPPWSTFLFRSLIKNAGFKARFKEKYYNYLDSTFLPQRMHSILDEVLSAVESEMPRHIQRWRGSYEETIGSMQMWRYYIDHMREMIDTRNQRVRDELERF